jgi:hypothetical protein
LLSSNATGGTGGFTYTWVDGTTTDTVTILATTDISYTIYVTDNSGCNDSAIANIYVNPLPNTILNASIYGACDTLLADTLTGTPAGGIYTGPFLTGNIFNPHAAGDGVDTFYYYYTDQNGCSNVAVQTIEVLNCTTSVAHLNNPARIEVYPNPASNQFTIELKSGDEAQLIEVYNITGQLEYQDKNPLSSNSHYYVNTSQFPTGMYFMKVLLQDGATLVQKVNVVK